MTPSFFSNFKIAAYAVRSFVFPPYCCSCAVMLSKDTIFCSACFSLIKPIASLKLDVTTTFSITVHAVSNYDTPLRSIILGKMMSNYLASHQLGRLVARHEMLVKQPVDCLVPIPLHWKRYAHRGFNQAQVIANVVAQSCKIPMHQFLQRVHATNYQSQLSSLQRKENVKGVFDLYPGYRHDTAVDIKGKHIVLVDDLCTTGATLVQAARVLIRYKPSSLRALVACRVV